MQFYTGIGARKTPAEIFPIMEDAAYRLARMGYVLRSGKAEGADAAFQRGVEKFQAEVGSGKTTSLAEIYIPWKGFKGGAGLLDHWDIVLSDIDREYPDQVEMRQEWVREVHDYWEGMTQGVRKMHERNMHQLFGKNLADAYIQKSKFVLYWCPETKKGDPKGGTATGVNFAKKMGIRTLNLLHDENKDILEKFLKTMEDHRGI